MKRISFKVPTASGERLEQGYVARLYVGNVKHRFVLQLDGSRPSILADYRSGYKLANLASLALAQYVANPYAYDDSLLGWRKRAQRTVDDIVAAKGENRILDMLGNVPALNA